MEMKGGLSDFERGTFVGARVFQKQLLIHWDFHAGATASWIHREYSQKRRGTLDTTARKRLVEKVWRIASIAFRIISDLP